MMKGKFEMDEAMDIMICTHAKDAPSVLEGVKACFSQEFPTEEFEWKCTGTTQECAVVGYDQNLFKKGKWRGKNCQ